MSKIQIPTKDLQFLSSGSKIGVQVMWFIVLIVLPIIFPGIIDLKHPVSLAINIIIALITSILFEILKSVYLKRGKNVQKITNLQLLTSVVLLTWFLHVIGRINGPFFVLYLLTIMESALNLSLVFPNIVVFIASVATVSEFVLLIFWDEISLSLFSILQLFIRIVSLFFMRSYGISLAQKFIDEQRAKDKIQSYSKNLEEVKSKLETVNEKLTTMDKQKDEFISMAAHELRAPMTAIKGYVSMVLEGDTGDIPEKARGFLADANNINDRLIRLVNNMLNVNRIEEGRMVYQIEKENLSNAVRAVYSQFVPEAERKGLDYKLDIPNEIKDKVKVDPDRVQEVVGNFISNAVKYTNSGSVKVRLSQSGKNRVRCEVVDTGPGISKEEQEKLFQKFHRVESNVGKTTGTGLGLYICKLLVERFNGRIGLESEAGKGSNFWFELPLVS